MTPLVIIGAGGFGRECHDIVLAMNGQHPQWEFLGFVDDGAPEEGLLARRGATWLGTTEVLAEYGGASYVVGVASAPARRRLVRLAEAAGLVPATLVHPCATVGLDVELGEGAVLCSHASVTTNVRIGAYVHLDQNVAVGHDATLGEYSRVNPGATISGAVTLEEDAYIGTNATVIQGLTVGRGAVVGAGAAVIRDVPSRQTVAGVPAHELAPRESPQLPDHRGDQAPLTVLFTSVGRRNHLVEYFNQALHGDGGRTVGVDAAPTAPGLSAVDIGVVVPPITAPDYVDRVLEVVQRLKVDALVPLNDLDILALSPHRDRFRAAGCLALVPSPDIALMCADKLRTAEFFASVGLPAPLTWNSVEAFLASGAPNFPVVVKPRFGSASLAVEVATDLVTLHEAWRRVSVAVEESSLLPPDIEMEGAGVLIQEFLAGTEYGMDVVNGLDRSFRGAALKQKLRMRSGETDQAVTVNMDASARGVAEQLSQLIGHQGVLDLDLFIEGDRITLLEMNPRFGGGYPFSHAAGMDAVTPLVSWLKGDDAFPVHPATDGVTSAKYDRIVSI